MFEMCEHAIPCRIKGLNGQSALIEYGHTSTALLTGSRDVLCNHPDLVLVMGTNLSVIRSFGLSV